MAGIPSFSFVALAIAAFMTSFVLRAAQAQAPAPAPTSDGQFFLSGPLIFGTSIDQGIAYILMLVALILTYLIHPLDASSSYRLF
ncbi:Arabinogalactan peptide 16 [Dendrobium catenatum]|uniref:Arabinogalactan peptide 16 n=1 Tax=Dendrobium catenatum TaxID=906689 RepID=A0A2I0X368_9ASPA|nr:Arabinogalactan peptide 16 [Dendrobium catenatum]